MSFYSELPHLQSGRQQQSTLCISCNAGREWRACKWLLFWHATRPDSELWLLNVNVLLNALQIIQKHSAGDTGE